MSLDPISAIFDLGKSALERFYPDPLKRAEELRKLEELRQKGDAAALNAHVQLMLAQIKVNEESAKHSSLFVAGARPAVIWVGVLTFLWSGVIHPLLSWGWAFAEMAGTPPPNVDAGIIGGIVSGLLGVAGMRSYDKGKGKAKDSL